MADGKANLTLGRQAPRHALFRLRVRLWPIVQTAAAAVAAWYLAKLLVSEEQPVFASIAAVISLGATHGRRDERALELIGGVVLGITVADLLVRVIGTGPLQIGLLVVLAMSAAVLLGGGAVLVTEAAVSAILLASLGPSSTELFSGDRLIEAMVGGGVAFAVSSLVFPLNAQLYVGRAAQSVFGQLGRVLDELATALASDDRARAAAALVAARSLEQPVRSLEEALETGRETARSSPVRRPARVELDRYARGARHIDYAVRNSRVLARHVLRFLRTGQRAPRELSEAIRELALAVWALAAEFEDAARTTELQLHVSRAAAHALATHDPARNDLALAEIVGQVRSTAIDLLRASEAVTHVGERPGDVSTEELLIQLPYPWDRAQTAA
jgi:uncharacterized membrane protein YgaE (UPF0421/DUF939 family)